ncbi:MAG: pyridoxal phosphate-dependent aminotransferase [Candidatus Riflebacteria bacterium]|nr:pyridoxal phosphate-dependent aminotransferase [Candidatus Riflebacteria bacterium]
MTKVSNRAQVMQASPIRKLIPFANQAKAKGINVYPLNIGQPDIPTPAPILDAMKNYDTKVLAYSPSQGEDCLIKAFVNYYARININLKPEEINVTTSGSEALFFAMMAICDVDDELVVFEPFYTNYGGIATETGVKLKAVRTYPENGFHLPAKDAIEAVITPKTKAILICNPNNPTGTAYTPEELNMLAEIAEKHDLFLISDEVYREFVYDGQKHASIMELDRIANKVILVDSVSKRYSVCGARIGLIASHNKEVMEVVLKFAQARLSSPTIEQVGAQAGAEMDASYFEPILKEYQQRRDAIMAGLRKIPGVICEVPGGAFYCIAKLPIDNAENFAKWLLTDFNYKGESVLVAPAQGFYATPGLGVNEIRLSYVLEVPKLVKAMEILGEAIKEYNKKA